MIGADNKTEEEKSEDELKEVFEESTKNDLSSLDLFEDFGDFDEE